MGASNWVHLDVIRVLRETEAAFLLRLEEGEFWFPKSQIDMPDRYEEGDEDVTISVTEWIAKQKGLE